MERNKILLKRIQLLEEEYKETGKLTFQALSDLVDTHKEIFNSTHSSSIFCPSCIKGILNDLLAWRDKQNG